MANLEKVRQMLKWLEPLDSVVNELKEFESVQQAIIEANQRLVAMRDEEASMRDRLDAEIVARKSTLLAEAKAAADEQVASIIEDARNEATRIVATGKSDASNLIADAQKAANATRLSVEGLISDAKAEVDAKNAELLRVNVAISAAQKRLNDVNEQIAAVRRQLGVA